MRFDQSDEYIGRNRLPLTGQEPRDGQEAVEAVNCGAQAALDAVSMAEAGRIDWTEFDLCGHAVSLESDSGGRQRFDSTYLQDQLPYHLAAESHRNPGGFPPLVRHWWTRESGVTVRGATPHVGQPYVGVDSRLKNRAQCRPSQLARVCDDTPFDLPDVVGREHAVLRQQLIDRIRKILPAVAKTLASASEQVVRALPQGPHLELLLGTNRLAQSS
ncbi:hypothetical protein [Jidongwangia harbinensis]|uniref:hypothetical protein n=1 Tax=Jidongwangia harbinensis TaxID=2878561 RepID=UPI001CDA2142|nr:hypothetical protein [Jidongwangia harbinensis]MCA2214145.1 hypothetical protein [Jidongwangia harbinensis]